MLTTVNNAAALTTALKTAAAGDTILLAPGAYALSITDIAAAGVVITSADLANRATVTSLNIKGTSGLTFSDLEFDRSTAIGENGFTVTDSHNIAFRRLDVHGSLDGNPQNDATAFLLRSSSNISIRESEFHELGKGIAHLGVDHLTLSGNLFHDIRTDGIRGGGSNWVTITGNRFQDFFPVAGDHADAIQFWTTHTTANAHDIRVADNVVTRGSGAVMQGVFLGDETAGVYYERVVIEGNVISGGMYHGINVDSAFDVTIRGNVVQGYSDMKSWIRVDKVDGANLADNVANTFLTAGSTNVVQTANTAVGLAGDAGAWAMAAWRQLKAAAASAPVEPISGGDGRDVLYGDGAADRILAGGDNDVIVDSSGANYLRGEDGDDLIRGGFDFDDIHGNIGADTAFGGAGDDWVVGGKDNDSLAGEAGNDIVYGNIGNDTVSGGAGGDIVRGGQDNDVLWGGDGADWLSGDKGDDTIDGGAGADTFSSFGDAGLDRINGFSFTEGDRVRLEPGTGYSVAQVGADVVVTLAGGGQMVLAGVSMSTLLDGWIA
jgi:Ca2+-binding RTX toxin-like protein